MFENIPTDDQSTTFVKVVFVFLLLLLSIVVLQLYQTGLTRPARLFVATLVITAIGFVLMIIGDWV